MCPWPPVPVIGDNLGHDKTSQLSDETNTASVCALEDQTKEQEEIVNKPKRPESLLSNVHRLPPEILGEIFHWNVMFKGSFPHFERYSYNFLLVCRHWFDVAWNTPELWSFWGSTPCGWARFHPRSAAAPVDLVLETSKPHPDLDATLSNVLRDRASLNITRRVHLLSESSKLLNAVISPLTPESDQVRSNRMESFILLNWGDDPVELSRFFSHQSFPKLQHLELRGCKLSSWAQLASQTGVLLHLDLAIDSISSKPTTTKLLSILASNPLLQKIQLFSLEDDDHTPPTRVPLPHLRHLRLTGNLRSVFGLLHRLDYPATLDNFFINLRRCTAADIPRTVGPYLRDHLRRCCRFQRGMGVRFFCRGDFMLLDVGDAPDTGPSGGRMERQVVLRFRFDQEHLVKEVSLELITQIAPEVVYFRMNGSVGLHRAYTQLPNLRTLHLIYAYLPDVFPGHNTNDNASISPSLRTLIFQTLRVNDGDWSPLTTFLAGRVSCGVPLVTLKIIASDSLNTEVEDNIRESVQEVWILS